VSQGASLLQPSRHRALYRRLRLLAMTAAAAFAAGLLHRALFDPGGGLLEHGLIGATIGGAAMALEIFVLRGRAGAFLRRRGFLTALALRTALFSTTVMLALLTAVAVFIGSQDLDAWIFSGGFWQTFLFSVIIAFLVASMAQISRLVGGPVLIKILLERYSRPVAEERIFLFLDLSHSTAIAEEMGDLEAYAFITGFFFDISEPIVAWNGETHAYVGDEVIVTWPMRGPEENARAVACYFAVEDLIAARAQHYRNRFGRVPEFRAGLHGGPVVAGECGDDKRQIVYLGDTVNTAARLEGIAKAKDVRLAISEELLSALQLPPGVEAQFLGEERLRGQQAATRVYSLSRLSG